MLTLLDLPNDILFHISEYLSVVEYNYLSQTSSKLRQFFHPQLFQRCCLVKNVKEFTTPLTDWVIPVEAFYSPLKYSWFENRAVKTVIFVNDGIDLKQMANFKQQLLYPRLESILIKPKQGPNRFPDSNPRLYPNLIIVNCDPQLHKDHIIFKTHIGIDSPNFIPVARHYADISQVDVVMGRNPGNGIYDGIVFNLYNLSSSSSTSYSDAVKCITSINLNLTQEEESPDSYDLFYTLLQLDSSFPFLKKVNISSSDRFSLSVFKEVIQSLPRCHNLEHLQISHQIHNHLDHLRVLDNLQGNDNWKSFLFQLKCDLPFEFNLRLPAVTEFDARSVLSPGITFDFGPKLKVYLQKFSFNNRFYFELETTQRLIENLAKLSVAFEPFILLFKASSGEHPIFTKELPNLKVLDFGRLGFDSYKPADENVLKHFEMMLELAPFGEFDLLNFEQAKPLICLIAKDCTKAIPPQEQPKKMGIVYSLVKSLESAALKSELSTAIRLFHHLQYLSDSQVVNNLLIQNRYINSKASLSILFVRILEFLPNLEYLNLPTLGSFEEFPTFHSLLRHHKALKKVYIQSLLRHSEFKTSNNSTNDEFYNTLQKFMYVYPFEGFKQFSVAFDSNYINMLIDVEAARNNYHLQKAEYLLLTQYEYDQPNNFEFKRRGTRFRFRTSQHQFLSDKFP